MNGGFLGGLKIGRFELGCFVHDAIGIHQFWTLDDPEAAQFKETLRRGIHIVSRVVRLTKSVIKQLYVQLGQRGPLEPSPAPSGDRTKLGGFDFGINDRLARQFLKILSQSMVFRTDNVHIKLDVVAHDILGTRQINVKRCQHF